MAEIKFPIELWHDAPGNPYQELEWSGFDHHFTSINQEITIVAGAANKVIAILGWAAFPNSNCSFQIGGSAIEILMPRIDFLAGIPSIIPPGPIPFCVTSVVGGDLKLRVLNAGSTHLSGCAVYCRRPA